VLLPAALSLTLVGMVRPSWARDAALQISPDGLHFIADHLHEVIPRSFNLGALSQQLTCLDLTYSNITAQVDIKTVSLATQSKHLRASVRSSVPRKLDVTAQPCVGPTVTCRLDFVLSDAGANGDLTPTLVGGHPPLSQPQGSFDVPPSNVAL